MVIVIYGVLQPPGLWSAEDTSTTDTGSVPFFAAPAAHQIDLPTAKSLAVHFSFDSRARAEELFRARQNINLAIGRLLPSFNAAVIAGLGNWSFADIAIVAVGFIYPSNWFRWRESRLFFAAEKQSFAALLANQSVNAAAMYFRIDALHKADAIYRKYLASAEKLMADAPIVVPDEFVREQPLRELTHAANTIRQDILTNERLLKTAEAEFFHALAVDPTRWDEYTIVPLPAYTFNDRRPYEPTADYGMALARAPEVKALAQLVAASHYAVYARAFDFINPTASNDGGLGFGYPAYVKIGRSFNQEYRVRLADAKAQIRRGLGHTAADYNWSLASYDKHRSQLANAKALYELLKKRFYEMHYFDDKLGNALIFSLNTEIGINENSRVAYLAETQYDRLLWQGGDYAAITALIQTKKPDKGFRLRRAFEDMRIRGAIKKGELPVDLDTITPDTVEPSS